MPENEGGLSRFGNTSIGGSSWQYFGNICIFDCHYLDFVRNFLLPIPLRSVDDSFSFCGCRVLPSSNLPCLLIRTMVGYLLSSVSLEWTIHSRVVPKFATTDFFFIYLLPCSYLSTYNISSTPYSCESLGGTWVALVAVLILFITSVISCWAPKPVPLVWRARRFFDVQDEADPCCGAFCCFGEKAKDDEVTDGAIETGTEKSIEKKNKEKIPLQNNDKSAAGVTANINAEGVRMLFFVRYAITFFARQFH